jgi:hypothetical protein
MAFKSAYLDREGKYDDEPGRAVRVCEPLKEECAGHVAPYVARPSLISQSSVV